MATVTCSTRIHRVGKIESFNFKSVVTTLLRTLNSCSVFQYSKIRTKTPFILTEVFFYIQTLFLSHTQRLNALIVKYNYFCTAYRKPGYLKYLILISFKIFNDASTRGNCANFEVLLRVVGCLRGLTR